MSTQNALSRPHSILWVVLVWGLALGPLNARAAADVTVNPSIVRPMVRAGRSVDFRISAANDAEGPRQFRVTVTNMTAAPQGFPISAPADDPRGCASWISVEPAQFSLPASGTQVVNCRLRAPRGAAGGYYALVTVESPAPKVQLANRSGAVILSRAFGTAILAVVPGRNVLPRLRPGDTELEIVQARGGSVGGWTVIAHVRNDGNVHAKVEGSLDLRDGTGRMIARTPLDGGMGTVLPSAVREYAARQSGTLSNGVYVATVRFSVPGTKIGAASSQAFSVSNGTAQPLDPKEDLRALIESLAPAVQVSPEEIALSGPAGSRKSSVLRLSNISRQPIDLRLAVSEWQLSEHGDDVFPDASPEHARSAAAWLRLVPGSLSLSPGGRGGVRLTAAVPPGTPDGDYFACVRARAAHAPEDVFYPSYATITVSVGRSAEASCEIKHISVSKPNTHEASVEVSLVSSAPRAIYPIVTVSIADVEGKTVLPATRLAAGECLVLPRQVRHFTMPLGIVLRPGRYVATVTATARENAEAVSDTVSFEAPPWQDAAVTKPHSSPLAGAR